MSHVLDKYKRNHNSDSQEVGRPYVCVTVNNIGKKTLRLETGSGALINPDTKFTRLPEDIKVVDHHGEEIPAMRGFWISTESIDPYHILIDWDGK